MPKQQSPAGVVGIAVFVFLWSLLTCCFDGLLIWRAERQWEAGSTFQRTRGVITKSQVEVDRDDDGPSYYPDIEYRFEVAGVPFTGDQTRIGDFSTSGNRATQLVQRYPVGKVVDVFYDPEDPSDAVLQRGLDGSDHLMAMFLLPFNLVMLGTWIAAARWLWARCESCVAGGARILHTGAQTRVRLPRTTPLVAAGVACSVTALFMTFVLAFCFQLNPPPEIGATAWVLIVLVTLIAYAWRVFQIGAGQSDLVIDPQEQTLSFPQTYGRSASRTVPWDAVRGIELKRLEIRAPENRGQYRHAVAVVWEADNGQLYEEVIAEHYSLLRARALADWLGRQIQSRPATPQLVTDASA